MRVPTNRAVTRSSRSQTDTSAQNPPATTQQRAQPQTLERTLEALEQREKPAKATRPVRLFDVSGYRFITHTRPDGQPVHIEIHGSLVIPHMLLPGGAELPPLILPGKTLNFLALGDGGHGTDNQRKTAMALTKMAKERGVNFGVYTGDIIYPHGISGPNDPQLKEKFVDMYKGLPEMHAVPGNHDYGSVTGAGIPEALVEAANRNTEGMFRMPTRYYSRLVKVDGLTIRTLFLDTATLAVDPVQLSWIHKQLAKDADYTLVFGHHPVENIGWHGSSDILKALLLPLLEARADLYVCGHEHNQQQLRTKGGLPTIVSGAASESMPTMKIGRSEFASIRRGGGFFTVGREGIKYEALSSSKEAVMFTNTFQKRERTELPKLSLPSGLGLEDDKSA
ncbi:MAG: metallophosphoesterase [Myxococcota bacterium]|nr:metallophosphoesterase [Myxococcota bacterium]